MTFTPLNASAEKKIPNEEAERIKEVRKNVLESEMFASTEWMPNHGVKLVKSKYAQKIWKDFSEGSKCQLPSLQLDEYRFEIVRQFLVFQTEALNIFLYERHMHDQPGYNWVVCDKTTEERFFGSYYGYPSSLYYDDGSGELDHQFGGCAGPVGERVRFRRYTEEGPQHLEAVFSRCQCDTNYHETLFHIDTTFEEVPGARVDMDYTSHPDRPWRWWHTGERYEPRSLRYNNEGNATWTRKLLRRPTALYRENFATHTPTVLVERECEYSKASRSISCSENILRKGKLKNFSDYVGAEDDLSFLQRQISDAKKYDMSGFIIPKGEISKIKEKIKTIEYKNKK